MAIRRNARLRREYLYAKSLEGKEKDMYDRKQRIKAALAGTRWDGCCGHGFPVVVVARRCQWFSSSVRHVRAAAVHVEGKAIPTELRGQAASLKHAIELEHAGMTPKVSATSPRSARSSEPLPDLAVAFGR